MTVSCKCEHTYAIYTPKGIRTPVRKFASSEFNVTYDKRRKRLGGLLGAFGAEKPRPGGDYPRLGRAFGRVQSGHRGDGQGEREGGDVTR